jgi:anaerobic selenocysteine-containing dehydrogenase
VTILAEITDQLMQGVVSIPHGWGHDKTGTGWSIAEQHAGVSVNDLTDDRVLDTLSGNAVLNGIPVHLQPLALMTESANAPTLATTD